MKGLLIKDLKLMKNNGKNLSLVFDHRNDDGDHDERTFMRQLDMSLLFLLCLQ